MSGCPYCGEMHSQLYVCDAMKAARAKADMAKTVNHMAKVDVNHMAKTTYRYRDPDKRRAYQRDLMRKRYHQQSKA
jgi:hypothetical protein